MSFWKKESLKKIPLAQKFFQKEDKRKLKKLVTGKNFDLFIMSIILADAVVLGMMTIDFFRDRFEQGLFLLDRLFMAIFIVEMVMKIYAERREFWKSGWNVFDFVIVAVSSVPAASAFIVIRSLRLFRMFKYIYQASGINNIITTFLRILPVFVSFLAVFAVFFYVFSIISVSLYGDVFVEFSTLGSAMQVVLQTFSMDGWAAGIARQVMRIFPNAWMFFALQKVVMFLLLSSFLLTAMAAVLLPVQKK